MERYICIHGHFYQPPRENPWLEAIELQDSAAPFHDWNERITNECYAPNAASRMLDGDGLIVNIVNNYSRISFNFGPTLLSWLAAKAPKVYAEILEADRDSRVRFSGHGSALAQVYNHTILPLMNPRDRRTVVLWGLRDFEHRFGRFPEGMWLAETAADTSSFEVLADLGVAFTVLSPSQASRVRKLGEGEWQSVEGGAIDPSMAYVQKLPSGRQINLFFYDGPISRAVAFEHLLDKGEHLAGRLTGGLSDARTWPQVVHIATDGESYGHHHRHGDMALAQTLAIIESEQKARLTNYGEFLAKHPPTHEVEIFENTSWSCAHGIERWRSDCGCNSGGHAGWNQAWRGPLRAALDWLRDSLVPLYEEKAAPLLEDPWKARDDYIDVLLDRSPERVAAFFAKHATKEHDPAERIAALELLEMQRHALLMYTSCGWFFDELSGIETVQVIQYAGRALQLASDLAGKDLESPFLELLEKAKSNIPQHKDGRVIFEKFVRPAMVDLVRVGAHHAVSSVFTEPPERTQIYCYTAEREDHRALTAGSSSLVVGRTTVSSDLMGETKRLSYAVLHFGDHNLDGAVRETGELAAYEETAALLASAFSSGDFPGTMRLLQQNFDSSGYSLRSLFRDEQRRILDAVIQSKVSEVQALYRQVYESNAPLMRFVGELGVPQPRAFYASAQLAITGQLNEELRREGPDFDHMRSLLDEAEKLGVEFDQKSLGFAAERAVERLAAAFSEHPEDLAALERLEGAVRIAKSFSFQVDPWEAQNVCWEVMQRAHAGMKSRAGAGDEAAKQWLGRFGDLAQLLSVRVR